MIIQFHYLGPIILSSSGDFLNATGDFADNQRSQLASFLSIKQADLTEGVVSRYIEVTPKRDHQAITPAHDKIRARIVEPLKIAKKSYCLEEYIASIAMSGVVGETMAHVFLQLYETEINGIVVDPNTEKAIFGKRFDELGQMRRIEILRELKYINLDQEKMLKNLQDTRRPYMHWWNLGKTAEEIKSEARQAVTGAARLFSSVFDIKLASASSISIDGRAKAFLDKLGDSIGPFFNSKY